MTSSPGAAGGLLIARLDKEFNLEETIDTGVSGLGRGVVPREVTRTECSSSLAIASGLLHLFPDARTIIRIDGQSSMAKELEDGLRKRLKVESNLLSAAGTGRLPEQYACTISVTMEDVASLTLKSRGTP